MDFHWHSSHNQRMLKQVHSWVIVNSYLYIFVIHYDPVLWCYCLNYSISCRQFYIFWNYLQEYTNGYCDIKVVIWDFEKKFKLHMPVLKMREKNSLNNLFFSLLVILKIKLTSTLDGDEIFFFLPLDNEIETYLNVKNKKSPFGFQ